MTVSQDNLQQLTEKMISIAKRAGADAVDTIAVNGTAVMIDVREGKLEQAERAEGIDIGLRVFVGQRQAIVSASDTRDATIENMAERAVAMAREAPEDPFIGLASADQFTSATDASHLELFDPSPEPNAAALQEAALEIEASAKENPEITQVQGASASYSHREMFMANSNGFAAGLTRGAHSLSCSAIAGTGTGMERDYDGDSRVFHADLRTPAEIGANAARRAVERLGARKPPTGKFPVLYDERVSSGIIGHLLSSVNGSAIVRGSSWLLDALGKPVLPSGLSILEDPTRPRAAGSRPFDAEGLATSRRTIVENGVLTGWTLDLATARKLDMQSTGNAMRGLSGPPRPGVWNISLTQGDKSAAELARDMGTGLWITSLIGATINPTTGDYSRGASGFWVENGEVAYPVNECTIAGNLRDMLMTMIPANDARTHLSHVVPSLLIEGLTIAGD
jgi:PmbA protein